MSINRVNISGNLTRDPELRATGSGMQILRFGVAVNDRARNQQTGEWEDRPNFVDCVVFGNRADALSRLLSKGSKVAIEGKLRYSSWETQDGQRRSKLEVVVDEVEFLSSRNQGGAGAQAPAQYQQQGGYQQAAPSYNAPAPAPAQRPVQTPPAADVYDEDIPFESFRRCPHREVPWVPPIERQQDMAQQKQDFQRQPRRKYCQFCKEQTEFIDYKDTQLLRKYMTDRGKIKPRRVTGACTQHQHDIANAIKRAREMALLPYTVPVVSSRGGRSRG